jgi:AraC-like DNA-binding protein
METGPVHASAGSRRQGRGGFGTGRVAFWNGGALWMGRATGAADAHAHHAIQLALALDAPFRIRAPRGDWLRCNGAVVASHAAHQFDGEGQPVAILFIEPETAAGRALRARHPGDRIAPLEAGLVLRLAAPLRAAFDADAEAAALAASARQAIDQLVAPLPRQAPVDPRIATAVDWIRAHLSAPLTLAGAAAAVHLSPGRFRHLFVAQTGTTFRAYLLWARVGAAVAAGMAGRSWTDAAQEAGFADSAHLARTCRRMIGLAPGMLARTGGR